MLATGWTRETLGRQPARVVRLLVERLWTARMWRPDIIDAASASIPHASNFPNLQAWADARKAQLAAKDYEKALTAALWPEGDDGD